MAGRHYSLRAICFLRWALYSGIRHATCTLIHDNPLLTINSAISYNFWMLVIARLVVGAGAAGLGYMVSLIFNGKSAKYTI